MFKSAAAALLTTLALTVPAATAKPRAAADCQPTASIQVDDSHIRFDGHCFTPGSEVGVVETYRSYDRTVSRTARANLLSGVIQDSPALQVDDGGNVRWAQGLALIRGGQPGRIVAVFASTDGRMADAETDVG